MTPTLFTRSILTWFDQHGRKHLPWQKNINAYRVWVSEIMLQQTQVSTVIPYFEQFMNKFPSVKDLAAASIDEVLHLWTGLGYYARARNLHQCAQTIVKDHHGKFPASVESLCQLPGVGRSTAGAICSIAFKKRAPILDGNVKRVLSRYYAVPGWPGHSKTLKQLWQYAEHHTPQQRCHHYAQAIMDLGATVCLRLNPQCTTCPLRLECRATAQGNPQDYPEKKPKKDRPIKSVQLLMLRNPDGEILLQQRPPQGIWGGLWSFPELPSAQDPTTHCNDHYGPVRDVETWEPFRHTFSHYHLNITPVLLHLKKMPLTLGTPGQLWLNLHSPQTIGLAAPVKALLNKLDVF